MEPREYLRLFRRRWWLIGAITFLGATFAWLTAPANVAPKVQRFKAEHTLIVEPESRQWTPENPETIALLASSGEVPNRVAARLSLPESEAQKLLRQVVVTGNPELAVITFTATTSTAERSQLLADTFAEELATFLDEQEADARARELESSKQQAADLGDQINTISQQLAAGEGDPNVLEERRLVLVSQYGDAESRYQALLAEPSASSGLRSLGPSYAVQVDAGIHPPRGRMQRAGILGFFGFFLALAAVVVLDRLDVRIKTKEEAELAFRVPVIAEIPTLPIARRRRQEVLSYTEPASSVAEAYRGLRTTLLILKPTAITPSQPGFDTMRRRASDRQLEAMPSPEDHVEPQVFLVTSTRPSEGKTTTTVNLAAAFAEAGRSVLVIGADIRRPEAHTYLGAPRSPGLTEALRGVATRLEDLIVPTIIPGVRMLPSGAHVSNPGELLLQGPDLITETRRLADIVLVDTTPMLTVNDAIQLIPATDAVVIACRAGRGTTEAAKRVMEILARLRAPVAGVVLVGARETPGVSSYYYGYQTSVTSSPLSRMGHQLRERVRRATGMSLDRGPTGPEPMHQEPPEVIEPRPTERRSVAPTPTPTPPPAPVAPVPPRPTPEKVDVPARATNGSRPSDHEVTPDAGSVGAIDPDPWGWP